MGILSTAAAAIMHEKADRAIAAEDDLRRARRSGVPATIAAAQDAVGRAEDARKKAEKAYRDAIR